MFQAELYIVNFIHLTLMRFKNGSKQNDVLKIQLLTIAKMRFTTKNYFLNDHNVNFS